MRKYFVFHEKFSTISEQATLCSQLHADVTLFSDDLTPFRANKFVLSACSTVMKELFSENPHPNPSIYMKGFQERDLRPLLQLMYYGKAQIFHNRMGDFFKLVEELKI